MAEVLITVAAEQDYTDALSWYVQRSEQAAIGFEAEFERAIHSIQADPKRFPL